MELDLLGYQLQIPIWDVIPLMKKLAPESAKQFHPEWEMMREAPTLHEVIHVVEGIVLVIIDYQLLQETGALYLLAYCQAKTVVLLHDLQQGVARDIMSLQNKVRA